MKPLKNLLWVLALAFWWAVGGYVFGSSIDALSGTQVAASCTSLNVIAGLLLLLAITRNEYVRRVFYEGRKDNESGVVIIALLWAFPFTLLVIGIFWWVMAQFFK